MGRVPTPVRRFAAARPVVEGGEMSTIGSMATNALHRFEAVTPSEACYCKR